VFRIRPTFKELLNNLDKAESKIAAKRDYFLAKFIEFSFDNLANMEPKDTGFLAASWYLTIQKVPYGKDLIPSQEAKDALDELRLFRRSINTNIFIGSSFDKKADPWPRTRGNPGPMPDFVAAASAKGESARSKLLSSSVDFSNTGRIAFTNTAKYVETVNPKRGSDPIDVRASAIAAVNAAKSQAARYAANYKTSR